MTGLTILSPTPVTLWFEVMMTSTSSRQYEDRFHFDNGTWRVQQRAVYLGSPNLVDGQKKGFSCTEKQEVSLVYELAAPVANRHLRPPDFLRRRLQSASACGRG
jgi:hypothetical protein